MKNPPPNRSNGHVNGPNNGALDGMDGKAEVAPGGAKPPEPRPEKREPELTTLLGRRRLGRRTWTADGGKEKRRSANEDVTPGELEIATER